MDSNPCGHACTSNCRRVGCNCECGEYHMTEQEYKEAMQENECYQSVSHVKKCEECVQEIISYIKK